MDGYGLKLEKKWPIFSSFDATCSTNRQEVYYGYIFVVALHKHFVYDLKSQSNDFSIFDLKQQTPRDTAPLRRHPPEVPVTSEQKLCTEIFYIVLQTSLRLFQNKF